MNIISQTEKAKKIPQLGKVAGFEMVEHIGLEPMTFCMPCRRSSQLS